MSIKNSFSITINKDNLIYSNLYDITEDVIFTWKVGELSEVNTLKFIPIHAVKCINYEDQFNDRNDLIRINEIYPVLMELMNPDGNVDSYLIINRTGHKQYWSPKDFEIILSA